jgi:hypothetical protein
MEYNSNVYVTISHTDCDSLGLGENHRKNNEGSVCILEFASVESIPSEVSAVILGTYTHQEALQLMEDVDWYKEIPQS